MSRLILRPLSRYLSSTSPKQPLRVTQQPYFFANFKISVKDAIAIARREYKIRNLVYVAQMPRIKEPKLIYLPFYFTTATIFNEFLVKPEMPKDTQNKKSACEKNDDVKFVKWDQKFSGFGMKDKDGKVLGPRPQLQVYAGYQMHREDFTSMLSEYPKNFFGSTKLSGVAGGRKAEVFKPEMDLNVAVQKVFVPKALHLSKFEIDAYLEKSSLEFVRMHNRSDKFETSVVFLPFYLFGKSMDPSCGSLLIDGVLGKVCTQRGIPTLLLSFMTCSVVGICEKMITDVLRWAADHSSPTAAVLDILREGGARSAEISIVETASDLPGYCMLASFALFHLFNRYLLHEQPKNILLEKEKDMNFLARCGKPYSPLLIPDDVLDIQEKKPLAQQPANAPAAGKEQDAKSSSEQAARQEKARQAREQEKERREDAAKRAQREEQERKEEAIRRVREEQKRREQLLAEMRKRLLEEAERRKREQEDPFVKDEPDVRPGVDMKIHPDVLRYYHFLGLKGREYDATTEDIQDAFRRLARKHHPDLRQSMREKESAKVKFQKLVQIYSTLRDPKKREEYDRMQTTK